MGHCGLWCVINGLGLGEIDREGYQSPCKAALGQLGSYLLIYEPLPVINFDGLLQADWKAEVHFKYK